MYKRQARVCRYADIDALGDIDRELGTQRHNHVVQHLSARARVRPNKVFFCKAEIRAVVVDREIDLAFIAFRRIREQLFLRDIGGYDIPWRCLLYTSRCV